MIEEVLTRYIREGGDPHALVADVVGELRPQQGEQTDRAVPMILALCRVLDTHEDLRAALRQALLSLLAERRPVSLYVDAGILPSHGFSSELWRRIGHKLLPEAADYSYLKHVFAQIFSRREDEAWVSAVPEETWLELLQTLRLHESDVAELRQVALDALKEALLVLSYRISAAGLEPELIRNHPELEDYDSPFISQNIEVLRYLKASVADTDQRQTLVMLDQCKQVISGVRRTASRDGTSISLTALLQRLSQQIERQELLLSILSRLRDDRDCREAFPLMLQLFRTLVSAECHKNDVRQHWRENVELLALRVTDNASRTGEHYITETRSEYFQLMRSAMGAGCIIAVMAMLKILAAGKHLPPLTEAIVFSLNYGLGFVLIHMLHFTVATKQPAMTAAAIAASISESGGRAKEMDGLVDLIAQTVRSQLAAIFGNVALAIPVAMAIASLWMLLSGTAFVTVEKSGKLLAEINPFTSGAVIYAGVAGVCLFLSGLIAGYHDNMAAYDRIPQRLRALGWLSRLLGPSRLDRVASYIENNLGAIAGNFYFGCLLGGMAGLGVLLGLPIDIRHIAFSSAFFGFSLVGLEFALSAQLLLVTVLGLALIGVTNLLVSFSLAIYVAMRSRKVTFMHWRILLQTLARRVLMHPAQFLLPPKN